MNKERRSEIKKANKILEMAIDLLEQYKEELNEIQEEEEEAFDNLPENFQDGIKGDVMQEAIDEIEYNVEELDDVIKRLNYIKEHLSVL